MNIFSLPAIVSFTINFSIALIVFLDRPKSTLNKWFSAFIFSFALWNISEIAILNSADMEKALLGAQILYRIIFLAPAFFLIIAYLFPRCFHSYARQIYFPILIFAFPILLLIFSFPHFQIKLVPLSQFKQIYYYHITFSKTLPFLLLSFIFIGYIVWGSLILILKIPHLRTAKQKNQTRFLLAGIVLIFILLIIINALRPYLSGEFPYYFLSSILIILISTFFLLAILQYKFFKISRIISGGITYSIFSSIILAVYFLVVKTLSESLLSYFGLSSFIFEALLILLLIILIRPLEDRIQNAVDRLLYRDINQYRRHFMKFSREMMNYHETHEFFHKIKEFLKKEFQLPAVFVYLKDPFTGQFLSQSNLSDAPQFNSECYLIKRLANVKRTIELYDFKIDAIEPELRHFLEKNHVHLLIPLFLEEEPIGILMLPQRKMNREFPEEIQEILTIFANEVATAYHRNLIIEKIRKEEREQFRLQHLAALGQLTAGIAHEIRNPLNTISTAAETIIKKKLPPEDELELKEYIVEEANRLNRILTDFLNLSRIKEPTLTSTHMEELIERVLVALETQPEFPITIQKEIYLQPPVISSDPQLLYQALLNLGMNALDSIRIRCQQESDFDCQSGIIEFKVDREGEEIIITVADNGIGIAPSDRQKIFEPFFTTKESGTGLGLSITHNIVQALNGKIEFSSRPGRTKFIIRLPQPRKERES